MKIQQKELFRWICEESGAEIDEESLTIGQIKLNGIKSHNDKSINEMKKMSLYANQHDHEAIVELAYAPNHNGDAWLGIDGFEKRTDVPRSRIVSINPRGEFIRRAIRKNEANTILYSPSDSNEKVVIFSIDPVSIDGKFYRCLSSLHAEFFLDFGYSNLYKLDSGGNELRFKLDEEWLTNLLCNAPFSSKQFNPTDEQENSLQELKVSIFDGIKSKFMEKFETLKAQNLNKKSLLASLKPEDIDSEERELYKIRLERHCKYLNQQLELIASIIEDEP